MLRPLCRSLSRQRRLFYCSGAAQTQEDDDNLQVLLRRKRKTEWKRRQGGQSFLDNLVINVRGMQRGDGCVAFHREKWKPMGPPSGGSGGRGGDVYILPTPNLTTLSSIPKRVRGAAGGNGQGTWQNGKNAPPTIIKVPLGTVVRELLPGDSRRAKDEWEAEEESLQGLDPEERRAKLRDDRWVHYPRYADDNAEAALYREERARRWARKQRLLSPINLDLDKTEEVMISDDAPLGMGQHEWLGHIVARGGNGGLGNPHFLSPISRSPKFATRGHEGERITLYLELKILADIGLVGMPNAGKSTLLRALTGGRAKTSCWYAFTTLNPIVGVIRVAEDGTFEGALQEPGHDFDVHETFRFTVADNPGLISGASENVGLGHSFLRSMERSLALVYVVDLSQPEPWDELRDLKDELEKYQPGMSDKAHMVIANKADLLGGEGDPDAEYVKTEMIVKTPDGERILDMSQNLKKVVVLMQKYVQQARTVKV
ncbi:GTP1/OBG domain-containing protein [Suillus cothurnatus]|nr:GTP1/OBG domain-containing protein [Suillus cothurnatus]